MLSGIGEIIEISEEPKDGLPEPCVIVLSQQAAIRLLELFLLDVPHFIKICSTAPLNFVVGQERP